MTLSVQGSAILTASLELQRSINKRATSSPINEHIRVQGFHNLKN